MSDWLTNWDDCLDCFFPLSLNAGQENMEKAKKFAIEHRKTSRSDVCSSAHHSSRQSMTE